MQYDFETLVDRRSLGSSKYFFARQAVPEAPADIIPFSTADMELKNPPELMAGLRDFLQDDNVILGYSIPTMGYLQALAGWMERAHHWHIDPHWLVPSPGVIPALYEAVRCFSQPGEGVLLFTPVYYPFFDAVKVSGRKLVEIPLLDHDRHYEIDWAAFEAAAADPANKLLLLCSPHNPVGRVWTREELARLSEIALRHNILVISDEIHSDLLMPGQTHTVYATLSEEAARNCIICTAPSKTFNLAGLQCANILIPNPELRQKFQAQMAAHYMRTLNIIGYKACELAYTRCDSWYAQLLAHIDHNRQFVEDFMARELSQIIVYPMEGTYLQWWDCRGLGMTPEELDHFMKHEAFLLLDDGAIFGETGRGFQRINLACPTTTLEQALLRLKAAVEKHR